MMKDKDGDIVEFIELSINKNRKHIAFYRLYAIAGIGDSMGEALAEAYLKKHVYERCKVELIKMIDRMIKYEQ